MAGVDRKQHLTTIDGTPEKRMFLSIINDYDLKTGLCELIDNALDLWMGKQRSSALKIDLTLDVVRQHISILDDAGGIEESEVRLLISPGASRNDPDSEGIGIFGVGGKRAGIALGERVEIRTRYGKKKSLLIELNNEWIGSSDWHLEIFEIPDIKPSTTTVDI